MDWRAKLIQEQLRIIRNKQYQEKLKIGKGFYQYEYMRMKEAKHVTK